MALNNIETFAASLNSVQATGPVFDIIQHLSDGVHESTPFLKALNKNAKKGLTGGDAIAFNIKTNRREMEEYKGGSSLKQDNPEFIKQAVLMRSYMTMQVLYHRTDILQNEGPKAIQNYVTEKIDDVRADMAQGVTLALFGDGVTDVNGRTYTEPAIVGLQAAITADETPSNIYAGHQRGTTTTYINNQALDVTNEAGITTLAMQKLYSRCTHMGYMPDLITCSDDAYNLLWTLARTDKWPEAKIEAGSMFDMGYPEQLRFRGATIVPDKNVTGTSSGGVISSSEKKIYFLNTKKGFEWKVDASDDMVLGKELQLVDQHSFQQSLTFNAQLLCNNPRLSGVMFWS